MIEPISLDEAKQYIRIDADDNFDDRVIQTIITGQRLNMERQLSIWLVNRTVTENYRRACCGMIYPEPFSLKYGPVVGDVVIKDTSGNNISVDNVGSSEWPVFILPTNADITYNAGYDCLPDDLRLALLQNIATAYENRENSTTESVNEVVNTTRKLSQPYSRNVF